MKIDYCSDLHLGLDGTSSRVLECFPERLGDVLILAGDIAEVSVLKNKNKGKKKQFLNFFEWANSNYKHVLYVFGNHEFYGESLYHSVKNMRDIFRKKGFGNIYILDNESITIDGKLFFGGTMWTSCRDGNPIVLNEVQSKMSDYYYIKDSNGDKILPEHTVAQHRTFKNAVEKYRRADVVITHHAPHNLSISPYYRSCSSINDAYYEELFDFIFDSEIKVWHHGHVHDPCDYMIKNTRVLCNPRGYFGIEHDAYSFKVKSYEL